MGQADLPEDETPVAVRRIPSHAVAPSLPESDPLKVAQVTDGQIQMLLDISRMLAVPGELNEMLNRVAQSATRLLDCERASIFLHDPDTDELWTTVALGAGTIRVPSHSGIVGHCFTHRAVAHIPDPYNDPRFNPEPDRRSGFRTCNLLSAPMAGLHGEPVGVIQAVNKRSLPFAENDLALIELLADQAGVALQRHALQQDAIDAALLKREMDLARSVQQALVPKSPPNVAGLTCAGWSLPASITGGDCYDLWRLPDGRLGVLVADASGHGVAPALIVSQVRTLVRALSETDADPHRLLERVNDRMLQDLDCGRFVTAFLGFISSDGVLSWSSAGHGPLPLRVSPEAPLLCLGPPVQPLGVIEWSIQPAVSGTIQMQPGGALTVPSDGIFEALDPRDELFGVERMFQVLDEHRSDDPDSIVRALRQAVRQWSGGRDAADDQTIVVVRRE